MPRYTYSAMDRIPESERVRIGYRYRDFLEALSCRTCGQKLAATSLPFLAAYVYFKEYQMKYGHYPILRASHQFPLASIRQKVHFLIPVVAVTVGF